MQKRFFGIVAVSLALLSTAGGEAWAQNHSYVTADFGTFHGVNGGPNKYEDVLWSQLSPVPPPGDYSASSGNCINTTIGYLCAPQAIDNITGRGAYQLQFSLSPNGQQGTISGSFNVNYSSGSESLELTVNYNGTSD